MEHEAERFNPVNPKEMTNYRREDANRIVGLGATPSMGLSQFRGGMSPMVESMKNAVAKVRAKKMKGKGREQLGAVPYQGVDEMREAYDMGRHLRDHLHELHGAGFHDAFCHGMSGGAWYDFLDPTKNFLAPVSKKIAHEFTDPDSYLAQGARKVANEFTNPDSELRRENGLLDKGTDIATGLAVPLAGAIPGLGTLGSAGIIASAQALKHGNRAISRAQKGDMAGALESGIKVAEEGYKAHQSKKDVAQKKTGKGVSPAHRASMMMAMKEPGRNRKLSVVPLLSGNVDGVRSGAGADRMLSAPMPVPGANMSLSRGGSMTGAYEGQGHCQKRIVGAGDGRRKRAEIVKRVMAEKGLKMIQASKYVKEHNLYHP